ncbi:MAG: hypothetical protein ACPG44_05035 [Polaribacter sp.]
MMDNAKFLWPYEISLKALNKNETYNYMFSLNSEIKYGNMISKDYIKKRIQIKQLKPKKEDHYRFKINTEINVFLLDLLKIKQQSFYERLHNLTEELDITITKKGIILFINNKDKIIEKWEILRHRLLKKFKGSIVENYLNKLDEKLNNEEELLNDIKQNRLLGFLFNNQYSMYGNSNKNTITKTKKHIQTIEYFPVIIDESLSWVGNKESEPIKISINGKINKHTPVETIKKYFKRKNKFEETNLQLKKYLGNYCINKKTGWIDEANFTMDLAYTDNYNKTQQIELLRLQ